MSAGFKQCTLQDAVPCEKRLKLRAFNYPKGVDCFDDGTNRGDSSFTMETSFSCLCVDSEIAARSASRSSRVMLSFIRPVYRLAMARERTA